MNRSKETQITAIPSSSFYQNVLLLTQMISPSVEFQQHFKKGMFDKPNTAGFLHASHYLLVIYDAKFFKRMVKWPILCKRDEAIYRVEMKNLLCVLSRDNPDLNFPSILMSHLIQAGGIKFQILMWKLSQLALRTYIKRKLKGDLLINAPYTSPAQDLTIAYLNKVIAERRNVVTETREKTREFLDAANDFLNDEVKILSAYKSEIFDRKENMKKLALKLPADSVTQMQLMDTEDSKVTDLWKKSIFHKVQYVSRKNKELVELERCCKRLCKLISRVNSTSSETFDVNKLPGMCCNHHESQSNIPHLIRDEDGSCSFSKLLWLLYLIAMQILHDIPHLSDLSTCLPSVRYKCEEMISLRALFHAMYVRTSSICGDELRFNFSQETENARADVTDVLITNRGILRQPPQLTLSLNQCTNDIHFYERLCPSPTEGENKHLFRRYKREHHLLRELPAALLDFVNSWNSMSGWLSPRAHCARCRQTSKERPLSPLYSQLLRRSNLDLNHSRENVSHSSSASYEALNLTPRKRPSRGEHPTTISNGTTARHLFTSTPKEPPSNESSNTGN